MITHGKLILKPTSTSQQTNKMNSRLWPCCEPSVSLQLTPWAICDINLWAHQALVAVSSLWLWSYCLPHGETFRWAQGEYGVRSHLHWDGLRVAHSMCLLVTLVNVSLALYLVQKDVKPTNRSFRQVIHLPYCVHRKEWGIGVTWEIMTNETYLPVS